MADSDDEYGKDDDDQELYQKDDNDEYDQYQKINNSKLGHDDEEHVKVSFKLSTEFNDDEKLSDPNW